MFHYRTYALILGLLIFVSFCCVASADVRVGVKKGDYVDYKVTFTGTPDMGHDISSARLEVTNVQGAIVDIAITSNYPNGTSIISNATLNLQSGHLIDAFIIPANLKSGEVFYDDTLGNVTITSSELHEYAGALRTALHGAALYDTYVWDQATGIAVEGTTDTPLYTMHSIVVDTNIWQPDVPAIYIAIVIIIIVAIVIIWAAFHEKKKVGKKAEN